MKTQTILKKSMMLTAALAFLCFATEAVTAAPLQSGSRAEDAIVWEQSGENFDQLQSVGEPQFDYDSVSGDCGCGQSACSDCTPAPAIGSSFFRRPSCKGCPLKLGGCGCCKLFSGCKMSSGCKRFSGCKLFSRCSQPAGCPGDICKLELDKSEITKKHYTTEQVAVCVPPVRLPWKKCCPPGISKTRLVTKLSTKKYKAPNCEYKWKLVEPEEIEAAQTPTAAEAPQIYESTPVYDSFLPAESGQITPTQTSTPEVKVPELNVPEVKLPEVNTPKLNTPRVNIPGPSTSPKALVPKIEAPKFPASNVPPPPPTTGALPWRANSPTS